MPGPGLDCIDEKEANELLDVIRSRELSRYRFDDEGIAAPSKTYQFEREMEELTGAKHCIGMNSCTSSTLVGLWAAGIGDGDEVIVPGYTFIAPISAIAYSGAVPILAEIDETLTIDPEDVLRKITPRTKAIFAVHMLGSPCDLDALKKIAEDHDLLLLEDCAQAGGGHFNGKALGTHGLFGVFSLNVFKTFTAGDGGIFLTNDTELYQRAFAIHDHGSLPNRVGVADADSFLGLNFRMHELTGALALVQLRKLNGILKALRQKKKLLSSLIGIHSNVAEKRLNDAVGDCATVLTYIFDNEDLARKVADGLGTITLADSGKHNYRHMPQLVRRSLPMQNEKFDSAYEGSYLPGALPATDNLLRRSVSLAVGVKDSYLGTGFGISIHSTKEEVYAVASRFSRQIEKAQATL